MTDEEEIEDSAKASRRHSAADIAHAQTIHDATQALTDGACCGKEYKAGARHSARDMADFQDMHDRSVLHGAACKSDIKSIELQDKIDAVRGAIYRESEKARAQVWETRPNAHMPYCDIYRVYDEGFAIARCGLTYYQVSYTLDGKGAIVPPFDQWQRVEESWNAKSIDIDSSALSVLAALPSVPDQYAIKSLGGDRVGCYAVMFGDEKSPDLSLWRDFFSKNTEFWLDRLGPNRPMTYEHGLDQPTKSLPVVGIWDTAIPKEIGVWVEGQLDTAHKYYQGVKWLIENQKLGPSSEGHPLYVQRSPRANKTHHVDVWPLVAVTLTTHPADYRQTGSLESLKSAYKAIGLELPQELDEPEATSIGATAQRDEAIARRLNLELELLTIE